ncbi:MAG: type 1 glutamine amidotransferase [Chloroflexota bacterium]
MKLTIGHLYADRLNIYGDRGNIIALARRAEWRGVETEVVNIDVGGPVDGDRFDILFVGGGQDKEQLTVCEDFKGAKGSSLKQAVEDGVVLLSICGGYQLLGHFFKTGTGETLPGISLFDAWTVAGKRRFIGNVLVESTIAGDTRTLVGFENHSGRTFLGKDTQPLGRVVVGFGNNGDDGTEGAAYKNAYGCYLHGSLLPKNPWFADHLILTALRRRYSDAVQLPPMDDAAEELAHRSVIEHMRRLGRIRSGVK